MTPEQAEAMPDRYSISFRLQLVERAIAIAAGSSDWQQESQQVGRHPVQQNRPDDRTAEIRSELGAT